MATSYLVYDALRLKAVELDPPTQITPTALRKKADGPQTILTAVASNPPPSPENLVGQIYPKSPT